MIGFVANTIRNYLGEIGDCLLLIISAIGALFGIITNVIIALSVWGYLRAMFEYVMYGYIAGFIISGICIISTIALVVVADYNTKNGHQSSLRKFATVFGVLAVVATIAMTLFSYVFKGNGFSFN